MKLKTKTTLHISILVLASLFVLAISLWWTTKERVEDVLTQQISERLVGVRDTKREQIEFYFSTIQSQVVTLAASTMTQEAMKEFSQSFYAFKEESELAYPEADIQESLNSFYIKEFGKKYLNSNKGNGLAIENLTQTLNLNSTLLQFVYISNNSNPLGEKDKLIQTDNNSTYNNIHSRYHPSFRKFLNEFGYYDIFLIDTQGNVVYSVYKELDYATSMISGAYSNSGLATAYKAAIGLGEGQSKLIDFEPYTPSYESPASFISSPIYVDGTPIGTLVFQMPVDRINSIMTYDGNWEKSGMGKSGETYLVGSDKIMRSNSRFLLEDMDAYLQAISTTTSKQIKDEIVSKETSIGLQTVDSPTVQDALNGQSGISTIIDYRGIPVVSAYTPLAINGVNWVLLSEIDKEEAYDSLVLIVNTLTVTAVVISLIMAGLASVLAIFLAQKMANPIKCLIEFVNHTAKELDFSGRYKLTADAENTDELRDLAKSFNSMMDSVEHTVKDVKNSSHTLLESVTDLMDKFHKVKDKSIEQSTLTMQISTAVEQLAATSQKVAEIAIRTSEVSGEGVDKSNNGQTLVNMNVENSETLVHEMDSTSDTMQQLAVQTDNIGKVLEVIKGIAEQTNLLALNAAIEAARAGEQGRGFAVVADEVRTLAKRTQDSTEEISQIIKDLQNGSESSVKSIVEANDRAQSTRDVANDVGSALTTIIELIKQIETYNTEVTTAASEQSTVTKDMAKRLSEVTELATDNQQLMDDAEVSALKVSTKSEELEKMVCNYKVA